LSRHCLINVSVVVNCGFKYTFVTPVLEITAKREKWLVVLPHRLLSFLSLPCIDTASLQTEAGLRGGRKFSSKAVLKRNGEDAVIAGLTD
jgi:hypothetical protein